MYVHIFFKYSPGLSDELILILFSSVISEIAEDNFINF